MPSAFALLLASTGTLAHGAAAASAEPVAPVRLQADMDGDAFPDRFGVQRIGEKVVVEVALARGDSGRLEFAAGDFHCSVVVPDPACGDVPQALEAIPLDHDAIADLAIMFDLDDADIFPANGRAAAVSIQPGDTDPFIFFWNAKSRQLDWLRL